MLSDSQSSKLSAHVARPAAGTLAHCAESFEDCESDNIAKRLKVLLQMSLVLLQGLKKPIIRVGRFAGQYAKPRSTDTETRDGVTLPCYRGDNVNRPGSPRRARAGSGAAVRGYERAS